MLAERGGPGTRRPSSGLPTEAPKHHPYPADPTNPEGIVKLVGPIPALGALYFRFVADDGALFLQLVERVTAVLADRMLESLPQ